MIKNKDLIDSNINDTVTEISNPIIKPIVANRVSTALLRIIKCSKPFIALVTGLINTPKIKNIKILPIMPST